jgi:hypothetical protein
MLNGPVKAVFDKTWRLSDIERIDLNIPGSAAVRRALCPARQPRPRQSPAAARR